MGGAITNAGGSNEPLNWPFFLIYIIFFILPPKIKIRTLDFKFCLNLTKMSLNMIILILLS